MTSSGYSHPKTYNKIKIGACTLRATSKWENIFYGGRLSDYSAENIACNIVCPSCYQTFVMAYTDFRNNHLDALVADGKLDIDEVHRHNIAVCKKGDTYVSCETPYQRTADYQLVRCDGCNKDYLAILGVTESQPGLYQGQFYGMWNVTLLT